MRTAPSAFLANSGPLSWTMVPATCAAQLAPAIQNSASSISALIAECFFNWFIFSSGLVIGCDFFGVGLVGRLVGLAVVWRGRIGRAARTATTAGRFLLRVQEGHLIEVGLRRRRRHRLDDFIRCLLHRLDR